ncbi:MAG: NADH-quinone oxidoreductase subunit NuoG [Pseudomonadota bacterium]
MVNIEIDGLKLEAEAGSMVIEAADKAGISIPRFCYHKKLSVAANCRMCLVEVANAPKPLPACATPVSDGMVVKTTTEKAREAQKSVMEFLLINHPLDCPICDQGGECELQDVAVGYGGDVSRFTEGKRVVKDKDIGPLIATDMTRCIHCTRCVRFGTEIAGMREMGATGRGEHTEIGTFVEKALASEVSGNIIDLCPVGALTAKPSRFKARSWEMQQHDAISPHDCLGSNLNIHTRRDQVIRVVPRENEAVNEVWISDRDRFSYEALNGHDRAVTPMIKKNGSWEDVSWEDALNYVVEKTQTIKASAGVDKIGALLSPSSTTEELYLAQKLLRGLGVNHFDHRLNQTDFRFEKYEPQAPSLGMEISNLETLESALLIGSDLRSESPIAALRLRKATRDGQVMAINPKEVDYNFRLTTDISVSSEQLTAHIAAVAKVLVEQNKAKVSANIQQTLQKVEVIDEHRQIAEALTQKSESAVLLGQLAQHHENATELKVLAKLIAALTDSRFGELSHGANAAGAFIAGALPHRKEAGEASDVVGKNAQELLSQDLKVLWLLNVEPKDVRNSADVTDKFSQVELVVNLCAFVDEDVKSYSDVILPIAAFTETPGTYVNASGKWQSFNAAVKPKGEARPAWKVFRVLGNLFEVSNFDYVSAQQVILELADIHETAKFEAQEDTASLALDILKGSNFTEVAMYDSDPIVRRAGALQQSIIIEQQEVTA